MRSNWLYFATRSDRLAEPVLIWPALVATAMSAMVASSVSPERWLMIALYLLRWAIWTESRVSVRVPIWLTLTRMLLPIDSSMPFLSRLVLVTNRSSPTSWTVSPMASVRSFQPSQSSSEQPSSIETIGYFLAQPTRKSTISAGVFLGWASFSRV